MHLHGDFYFVPILQVRTSAATSSRFSLSMIIRNILTYESQIQIGINCNLLSTYILSCILGLSLKSTYELNCSNWEIRWLFLRNFTLNGISNEGGSCLRQVRCHSAIETIDRIDH